LVENLDLLWALSQDAAGLEFSAMGPRPAAVVSRAKRSTRGTRGARIVPTVPPSRNGIDRPQRGAIGEQRRKRRPCSLSSTTAAAVVGLVL